MPRVSLVPFSRDAVAGLVAGTAPRPAGWHPEYPSADTLDAARMLLDAYAALARYAGGPALPDVPVWWLSGIVVDGQVVGDAGFHGPPRRPPPGQGGPVEVEIGYQVVPAWRGRGVATQACALLLAHARAHGADVVRADAEPENVASRAVLRANGFRLTPAGDFAVGDLAAGDFAAGDFAVGDLAVGGVAAEGVAPGTPGRGPAWTV